MPQQEVTDSFFPGRTDNQLRIRYAGGIKIPGKDVLRQLLRITLALSHLLAEGSGSTDNLIPATVIQRKIHLNIIFLRPSLRVQAELSQLRRQAAQITEETEPNPVLIHIRQSLHKIAVQELHDTGHFLLGTTPVFCGKRINRQILHADGSAIIGNPSEALRSGSVSCGSREPSFFGPASISIHNDGNMSGGRQLIRIRKRQGNTPLSG